MRSDYPYNEALDALIVFFCKRVKNDAAKKKLLDYLEECRKEKTVTFRYIHEQYMAYRKENADYEELTENEKELFDDLFHFWG